MSIEFVTTNLKTFELYKELGISVRFVPEPEEFLNPLSQVESEDLDSTSPIPITPFTTSDPEVYEKYVSVGLPVIFLKDEE